MTPAKAEPLTKTGHAGAAPLCNMRLLFLSQASTFGGHEEMAVHAATLLSRNVEVVFVVWVGNARLRAALEAENARGACIGIELSAVRDARLNPLLSLLRWASVYDVWRRLRHAPGALCVLVQGRIESGSVALLAARLGGIGVVSYLPMAHRLVDIRVRFLPGLRDLVNAFYYRLPRAYVTISAGIRCQLRRHAPRTPVHIVENWIRAPVPCVLDGCALRRRWGMPVGARVAAVVGRVDFRQKGHDALVKALATPDGRASDLVVCVVGDGPDLPGLRKLVAESGLASRFVFVPWIEGGMDALYAAVDAVVIPSLYEGVPLVMLEALSRRIPVAGSNVDGMAEWLPAAATAPRDDAAALLRAIRFACEGHPAAYADAYARASRRTDEEAYARAWAAALADCATASPA